jgi:hypothetical protein
MAPEWDGGVYYAAQRRSATAAEKESTGSLGVFYYSRWRSPEAATGFSRIYEAELGRKYDGLKERKADEADSREKVFTSNEGDVLISRSGDSLFISEGFPLETARTLRESTTEAQGSGPLRMASAPAPPAHELTFGFAAGLEGLGVMKSVIKATATATAP